MHPDSTDPFNTIPLKDNSLALPNNETIIFAPTSARYVVGGGTLSSDVGEVLSESPSDVSGAADWERYHENDVISVGTVGESILEEAQRLTHGPRRQDYAHPFDWATMLAGMVNAALAPKLNEPLTPEDMGVFMALVKISRQMRGGKRDNMVDLAGYAWVIQEIIDEKVRRSDK